jgi:6-phospho-beta-glucosidase
MKLCVIGAGSSYTPELMEGLISHARELGLSQVWLMDIDERRLEIVGGLARRMAAAASAPFQTVLTSERDRALDGSSFVIAQIRVGGMQARIKDERIPLRHGIIGQETTGPGGFAKALRTVPVMVGIARDMERLCPGAWLINFTNPSGLVTEAVCRYSRVRALGLCNGPIGMQARLARLLEVQPQQVTMDYLGLNHLGFVRRVFVNGADVTSLALEKAEKNASEWEAEFIRTFSLIPNSYLRYYYARDEALREQQAASQTRGEIVAGIEAELLRIYAGPALDHKPPELSKRGGANYSQAAVAVILALTGENPRTEIVNVRNDGAIPDLPPDSVVEIPAALSSAGATPAQCGSLPDEVRGLVQAVKAYELLTIRAGMDGDRKVSLQALVAHPLVLSLSVARGLLDDLLEAHRELLPQFFGAASLGGAER